MRRYRVEHIGYSEGPPLLQGKCGDVHGLLFIIWVKLEESLLVIDVMRIAHGVLHYDRVVGSCESLDGSNSERY